MRLVRFIDGEILAKIEWVSHKLQMLTGWDCFRQARFCYVLAAGFLLWAILALTGLPWWFIAVIGSSYAIVAAAYLIFSLGLLGWDDWQRKQAERGFRNPARVEPVLQQMRLALLCFAVFLLVLSCQSTDGSLGCIVLANYLNSCDPLPPCRGKVREWWKRTHRSELQDTHGNF